MLSILTTTFRYSISPPRSIRFYYHYPIHSVEYDNNYLIVIINREIHESGPIHPRPAVGLQVPRVGKDA